MDSQIELYPHNQIAYDKLCDMLSQSDRACVIQPTGPASSSLSRSWFRTTPTSGSCF